MAGAARLLRAAEGLTGMKKAPERGASAHYVTEIHRKRKNIYRNCPEMVDRAFKKEYNTILHQYAK